MKYISIFLFLIIALSCHAFNYPDNESVISNFIVNNAQWITPSDGTPPQLKAYDAKLELSNGQSMTLNIDSSYLKDKFVTPVELANKGDLIKISREGFHPSEKGKSWFEITNPTKGWNLILKGTSLQQKNTAPLPSKEQGFFHVKLPSIEKSAEGEGLKYIFNLHNTTLTTSINHEIFHNFYDGMIVQVNNVVKSELDQYGNYHYNVELTIVDTGEIVNAKTEDFNSNKIGIIASIEPLGKSEKPSQFKIVLEDKHELFINFQGSLVNFEETYGAVGDSLELEEHHIKECSPTRVLYCLVSLDSVGVRFSQYTVKNLRTNNVFKTIQSPQRKERALSILNRYDWVLLDWGETEVNHGMRGGISDQYLRLGARENEEHIINLSTLRAFHGPVQKEMIDLLRTMTFYAYMPVVQTSMSDNKWEFYFPDAKIKIITSASRDFIEKIIQE